MPWWGGLLIGVILGIAVIIVIAWAVTSPRR